MRYSDSNDCVTPSLHYSASRILLALTLGSPSRMNQTII